MSKFFYAKLAIINLKRNSKTYIPYTLTCIGTIIMFYNMCSLTYHETTGKGSVASMMQVGTIVTGIFSVIFLFYTNSFLVKRRKKEFGLFNILGMEKKHIGRIMLWETIDMISLCMITGLLFGIIFSKLISLILFKMLRFDPGYQFVINDKAIVITVILFSIIFMLTFLSNLYFVHLTNPIELLKGGNVGEREPKTKIFITLLGIITLGSGYTLALVIDSPVEAIQAFLIAVILVMIGTYCLFTAGSIALLKLLRKNKKYYYQSKHFINISGMIYRMKQNAVGLANICLLSTAVLVLVSTTVCMFIGVEDALVNRYPTDIYLESKYSPTDSINKEGIEQEVRSVIDKQGRKTGNYEKYSYLSIVCEKDGNSYDNGGNYLSSKKDIPLMIITADQYNQLSGKKISLGKNEVLRYSKQDSGYKTICLLKEEYQVKQELQEICVREKYTSWLVDTDFIVISDDDVMKKIYDQQKVLYGDDASKIVFQISFNLDGTEDQKKSCGYELYTMKSDFSYSIKSKQLAREEFFVLYGGLLFLGLFLGSLFLMATVLIIYYKQVIEGFEDKERFLIMQNVGMSKEEVRKSISSQVLSVFFIPILMALIHIVVAFPILVKLLAMLNLTNVNLFVICTIVTILVFIVVYVIVYLLTAKVYYRIVNQK